MRLGMHVAVSINHTRNVCVLCISINNTRNVSGVEVVVRVM